MIIIWRGLGLPIMMAGLIVVGLTVGLSDRVYLMTHMWPRLLAFGGGGVVVYLLAWWREKATGMRDSVYWIPMKVWAVVLLAMGICWSLLPAPSSEVARRSHSQPIAYYSQPSSTRVTTVNGLRLQGIFCNVPGHGSAIINNQTVLVGDKVGDYTVSVIEPQTVTLRAASGRETVLKLSDVGQ